MFQWLRKWHVIVAVVLGVYLAIPKTTDPIITFGDGTEFGLGARLVTKDGYEINLRERVKVDQSKPTVTIPRRAANIDKDPPEDKRSKDEVERDKKDNVPFVVELDEATKAQIVKSKDGGWGFGLPWANFKPNLGQDLAGGTSLRMLVRSEAVTEAETELSAVYESLRRLPTADVPERVRNVINAPAQLGRPFPTVSEDAIAEMEGDGSKVSPDLVKSLKAATDRYTKAFTNEGAEDLVNPTIEKLNRRLNSSGMTELNIVKAGINELEVKLPSLSTAEAERIKDMLRSTGRLEFLLLPSDKILGDKKIADIHPGLPEDNPTWYRWYEVLPSQTAAALDASGKLEYDPVERVWVARKDEHKEPVFGTKFAVVTERMSPPTKFVGSAGEEKTARVKTEVVLVQVRFPDTDSSDPDALLEGYPVTGESLANASASSDRTGGPAVSFELKGRGVSVMGVITGKHNVNGTARDPRMLAVAIDRKLYSSATINGELTDNIQVSGRFTRAEVQRYVDTLKSGSLPVSLTLIGEETVGPAEGADNIDRGLMSLIVGGLLVVAFALFFYRRTGLLVVANLALVVILIIAVMAVFLSTLTLPGIAGLVLTIGMAIDSNILINERIKEERAAGASGRAAIEAGFSNAFSAIVDGNLTTLITSIILAKIGTGAIAGFALTLSIGILSTMYVALLVYRTSLFFCFDKGWIPEVTGTNLFPNREFDFLKVGKRVVWILFAGMLASFAFFVVQAGNNEVLGIDFRGGTQVVMQLREPVSRNDVISNINTPGVQVQVREFIGDPGSGAPGLHARWEIRFPTSTEDEAKHGSDVAAIEAKVIENLSKAFSGKLSPDGFTPAVVGVTSADLTATLSVNRPGTAKDSEFWLAEYLGIANADNPSAGGWFGSVGGTAVKPTFTTEGNVQSVVYRVENVTVNNDADLASKKSMFHAALRKHLHDDLREEDRMVAGGATAGEFPTADGMVKSRARKGSIQIGMVLLMKMKVDVFTSTVKGFMSRVNDPLFDDRVTVTPVEAPDADNRSAAYTITTAVGDLHYDSDGKNLSFAAAGVLRTELERWFDDNEPGNHIANPFPKVASIGGRVAGEMKTRAIIALLIALVAIVIYIGIRFRGRAWGYAAVAALVHDTLFTLGAIALADYFLADLIGGDLKIDLNSIAALLTVIGYSLNDTIIIFDRVREELLIDVKAGRKRPMGVVINKAVNLTLSRTILTSGSTFVVVLAMVVLGGPAIRTFAWTLLFGLLFGTYSSIFRAGPFLLFFTGRAGDIRTEVAREQEAREEAERAEAEALAAISTDREDISDEDQAAGAEAKPAK